MNMLSSLLKPFLFSLCFVSILFAGYDSSRFDDMFYHYFEPDTLESGRKYPLVLFLHGAGGRKSDLTDADFAMKTTGGNYWGLHTWEYPGRQNIEPVFAIAPRIMSGIWAGQDWETDREDYYSIDETSESENLSRALALVDYFVANFPIDENRLYITGQSMGGGGCWDAIMRHPDKFAAAVPVAGYNDSTKANLIKHMPLWIAHSDNDNLVKPTTDMAIARELQNLGADVKTTWYSGIFHNGWKQMYKEEPDLERWMFSHTKGVTPVKELNYVSRRAALQNMTPSLSTVSLRGRKIEEFSRGAHILIIQENKTRVQSFSRHY